MLKKYKNKLLEKLTENELSLDLFNITVNNNHDGSSEAIVSLTNSRLTFIAKQSPRDFHSFNTYMSRFEPNPQIKLLGSTNYTKTMEDVLSTFNNWLNGDIKSYLMELDTPIYGSTN